MNTPEYKKAYLSNLKLEISNNNKNLVANQKTPSLNQYVQNGGSVIGNITNTQAKGTKFKGFK
jgi:hypothetical protein